MTMIGLLVAGASLFAGAPTAAAETGCNHVGYDRVECYAGCDSVNHPLTGREFLRQDYVCRPIVLAP